MSSKRSVFHERRHTPDPWADLRRDIAPVWQTPNHDRVDRLRSIVDELEGYEYPWAADLQNMLKGGRFMELIEALLRGLCAYSKERRELYEAGLTVAAELQAIIKDLSRLSPTEKRSAAIDELKIEHDIAMSGAAEWAEWHPLLTTAWPTTSWEEWSGRYPDNTKKNLHEALVLVLLAAGYDEARRSHWRGSARNRKTAERLAKSIAAGYGFSWEHPPRRKR